MDFITIYHLVLYYICLLLIAQHILDCKPRTWMLYSSFLVFLLLALLTTLADHTLFSISYVSVQVLQFVLIKLAFKKAKIRQLLFSYIVLNCLNMILVSIAVAIVPAYHLLFDYLISTVTATFCLLFCFSKIRHTVRQIIEWTPKYVLMICGLLLVSATVISVFISGTELYPDHDILFRATQIIVSVLLLGICIVLPVIILISVSNSQLRSLTANYEQQIHTQAEHYQNLAAANYEVRRFRHDFRNISIAIMELLTEGKSDAALELLQECNQSVEPSTQSYPSFDTGNGIADAILIEKQAKATAFNTSICFQGIIPANGLSPTDLCVILGNTLDNAIEACQKLSTEEPKTITVTGNCNSGFLFLTVRNPVAQNVTIQNNHIVTTKANKTLHGFGLYSLHSVVKRYDGEVKLSSTDDCFTVDIDLCLKNSQKCESCLPQ